MKKSRNRFSLFFCLYLEIFAAFVIGSTIYIRGYHQEHFDYEHDAAHFNIFIINPKKRLFAIQQIILKTIMTM